VIAGEAETALVVAADPPTVQGSDLVLLERLQVPVAVRRVEL
jgi:hypothetical protein